VEPTQTITLDEVIEAIIFTFLTLEDFVCHAIIVVRIQDSGFRIQDSGFRIQDSVKPELCLG